jgi:hypothetical protein
MNKKEKDDYIVPFQDKLLSNREAKKVGLAIILGLIGAIIAAFSVGSENKIFAVFICFLFVAVGYFWIGNKFFKR